MMVVNDYYVAVGGDFRCPPILAIVLRVLSAYIQASRLYLHQQVTANTGVIAAATSTGDAAKVQSNQCSFDEGGEGKQVSKLMFYAQWGTGCQGGSLSPFSGFVCGSASIYATQVLSCLRHSQGP